MVLYDPDRCSTDPDRNIDRDAKQPKVEAGTKYEMEQSTACS